MSIIDKYFTLSSRQQEQIGKLPSLYAEWNSRINVISRKDIDNLLERHVLHSMAIAKAIGFKAGTEVLDLGTGGGFPGIPLAILFPDCHFTLIDGTEKKLKVAQAVSDEIGLNNVTIRHIRGEEERGRYDFVVSRAVMKLPELVKLIRKNISPVQHNAMPNGLFCLKGGNLADELAPFRRVAQVTPLTDYFDEEWFAQDKQLIYVPL